MKDECKVPSVKMTPWIIAVKEGTEVLFFIFSNMVLNMESDVVLNMVLNNISSKVNFSYPVKRS